MPGNRHVRCGGRPRETGRAKSRHRALGRSHERIIADLGHAREAEIGNVLLAVARYAGDQRLRRLAAQLQEIPAARRLWDRQRIPDDPIISTRRVRLIRGGTHEGHVLNLEFPGRLRLLATTAFLDSFGPDKVLGASAAQLLVGVGRPGLSRGLIEDVRDSLESSLWYMRLEGGRYRFTTEPNLNKVILERESAITDDRIETLLRDALSAVAPSGPTLRLEPRIRESGDLSDGQQLTLSVLDFGYRIGGEASAETMRAAQEILEHRGGSWRTHKNAAMLIAADAPALAKARASARNLGALRDLTDDRHRLSRFNTEQREQLAKRLASAGERLPQQVTMAYRHLLLLGESNGGGTKLDHIDLGPARADATISARVLDYLSTADRLVEEKLAPAALLAARFVLLPDGTDSIELDKLFGLFYQLPRLPKLAGPQVLRQSLTEGVRQGLFGLASGSAWDADDSVLRFSEHVDPSEIQFQPGTWLVRAAAIKSLIAARRPAAQPTAPGEPTQPEPVPIPPGRTGTEPSTGPGAAKPSPAPSVLPRVTLRIRGIPGGQAREVIKVAVLPLSAASPEVTVEMVVHAEGGVSGIPRETLDLVVREGLRQLGLHDVDITIPPG